MAKRKKIVLCTDPVELEQQYANLKELVRRRRQVDKTKTILYNKSYALVYRVLGGNPFLEKGEQDEKSKQAANLVKCIVKNTPEKIKPKENIAFVPVRVGWVLTQEASAVPQRSLKRRIERDIRDIVRTFPIWQEWEAHVKGLGTTGLGYIYAVAGNLWNYSRESKLHKRMCCGWVQEANGEFVKQGKPTVKTAEAWIEHGYDPDRKAQFMLFVEALRKQKGTNFRDYYERKKAERVVFLTEVNPPLGEKKHKTEGGILGASGKHGDDCLSTNLLDHVWRRHRRLMPKPPAKSV